MKSAPWVGRQASATVEAPPSGAAPQPEFAFAWKYNVFSSAGRPDHQ
jgi:hypothetical protein